MGVCPVGAIRRDTKTEAVLIDRDACIGCRVCMIACPFGAITFDLDRRRPIKCDLCEGDPRCVKFCETRALTYGSLVEAEYDRKRVVGKKLVEASARSTGLP